MKKNELLCFGDKVIRILDIHDDRAFIIDCTKPDMPVWVDMDSIVKYSVCTENELRELTGSGRMEIDSLDAEQKKVMYGRYTMIARVLPFLSDEAMRPKVIRSVAEEHNVSKQIVRNYLCQYLAYMDIAMLAPKKKYVEKSLTKNEKNMRWSLNKYFYTTKKNSLKTAYTMMLKEKYCDGEGKLMDA